MSDVGFAFYKAVKRNSFCLVCENSEVTFHHVNPSEKLDTIGKIAQRGALIDLVAEFNKCVPLCWTHHREVHSGLRQGWLDGLTDKGKQSHHLIAQKYMPYVPWFNHKNPLPLAQVRKLYVDDIDKVFRGIQ
jgi:hypothetical protein